jgi:hypothetical protein
MGLEEKRIRKNLEEEVFPAVTAELENIYGGKPAIEIDWDSFSNKESMQEIQHQALGRVIDGIKALCIDDIAKEAMQESFKIIYVKNLENKDDRLLDFKDGKLKMETTWTDFWSIFSAEDIRTKLEESL